MELKKSPKYDLERKKGLFLEIGLIFALAVTLVAFEWKNYDKIEVSDLGGRTAMDLPEEMVQITQQQNLPAEADEATQVEAYVAPVVQAAPVAEESVEEMEIFTVVEDQPNFPGGDEARMIYLKDNIKYPQMARESGIQGTVYITFVVERNGSVTDVKVLRGIGGGCDEEAIRVIENMPKWNPGKQRGKPVRVQFNMPIKFTLAS